MSPEVTTERPRRALRPASDVDEAGDEVSHSHDWSLINTNMPAFRNRDKIDEFPGGRIVVIYLDEELSHENTS